MTKRFLWREWRQRTTRRERREKEKEKKKRVIVPWASTAAKRTPKTTRTRTSNKGEGVCLRGVILLFLSFVVFLLCAFLVVCWLFCFWVSWVASENEAEFFFFLLFFGALFFFFFHLLPRRKAPMPSLMTENHWVRESADSQHTVMVCWTSERTSWKANCFSVFFFFFQRPFIFFFFFYEPRGLFLGTSQMISELRGTTARSTKNLSRFLAKTIVSENTNIIFPLSSFAFTITFFTLPYFVSNLSLYGRDTSDFFTQKKQKVVSSGSLWFGNQRDEPRPQVAQSSSGLQGIHAVSLVVLCSR